RVARDAPPQRERGLHVGRRLAIGHERIEDLTRDQRAGAFQRRHGIEGGGETDHADANVPARGRRRRRRRRWDRRLRDGERGARRTRQRDRQRQREASRRHSAHSYTWNRWYTPPVSRSTAPRARYRTCSTNERDVEHALSGVEDARQ